MSIVLSLLTQLLHIGLMIAAAPSIAAMMDCLDARLSGRSGPPITQPWRDLIRLSRKTPVTQESHSVVSLYAPAIGLGATLSAALLIPAFALGMALGPLADIVVIVSLMTTARVATGLVALDAGAALPGLAMQTASMRSILAEPALLIAAFSLAPTSGSFNIDAIIAQQRDSIFLPTAASAVTLGALLILVFADADSTERGIDQMLNGSDLAIARMTEWLRRLVWLDLIGGVFLPIGIAGTEGGPLAWLIGLAAWATKLMVLTFSLSFVLTILGRIPRHGLLEMMGVAALLAVLATIMMLAATGLA